MLLKFADEYMAMEPALNVHGAVGCGELMVVHLAGGRRAPYRGGVQGEQESTRDARRHLTVCGEALDRAVKLESASLKGEFLFDRGTKGGQGPARITVKDARLARDTPEATSWFSPEFRDPNDGDALQSAEDAAGEFCAQYAPEYFCRMRSSGGFTGDLGYQIGRHLHVCTVFVQLVNIQDKNTSAVDVKRMNLAFGVLRGWVSNLDGVVDTLLCDDKGFVFKAVFGLTVGGSCKRESEALLVFITLSTTKYYCTTSTSTLCTR